VSHFCREAVAHSQEVSRIKALPRRAWTEAQLDALAKELTAKLRTDRGAQKLRRMQALSLHDFAKYGGLVGLLRVGAGKTLITMLLPKVAELYGGVKPKSPVLILPAALVEKTEKERRELSRDWKVAQNLRLVAYEKISRVSGADWLEIAKPDLIILDEAHRAKNKRAGVTRRIMRYVQEHPDTKVCVLSGTLFRSGLRDAAHLVRWALKNNSPVPLKEGELEEWADALDEKVNPLRRRKPGALLELNVPHDWNSSEDQLTAGRKAFYARLAATPGVVSTGGDQVACSLNIQAVDYREDSITNGHFETLRSKWETPDGWALTEAVSVWRHARELALGMHYIWDPRPPKPWLDARREWASYVRKTLARSRHLDTELQVRNAVHAGELESPELAAWEAIAPTFKPNPKPVWHDTSALEICEDWMKRHNGIVWCEHTFFAEELARRTGVPYFGAQGKTKDGLSIVDFAQSDKAGKVPIIASIAANSTGRNLQAWSENLITTGITQAAELEQLLGRTHRDGTLADEINVYMLMGCYEHFDAFQKARAQAIATRDTYGADQKVLIATVVFPTAEKIKTFSGARWQKNVAIETPDFWGDREESLY
jgi:hypothetical protein